METNGQLYLPIALPPGNEPRYPLTRRLGGPWSRYGRFREWKNLPVIEIQFLGCAARSTVTMLTELQRITLRPVSLYTINQLNL